MTIKLYSAYRSAVGLPAGFGLPFLPTACLSAESHIFRRRESLSMGRLLYPGDTSSAQG